MGGGKCGIVLNILFGAFLVMSYKTLQQIITNYTEKEFIYFDCKMRRNLGRAPRLCICDSDSVLL